MYLDDLKDSISGHWSILSLYGVPTIADWLPPSLKLYEKLHHFQNLPLMVASSEDITAHFDADFSQESPDLCPKSRTIIKQASGRQPAGLSNGEICTIADEQVGAMEDIQLRVLGAVLFSQAALLTIKCEKISRLWSDLTSEPTITKGTLDMAGDMLLLQGKMDNLKSRMTKMARVLGIPFASKTSVDGLQFTEWSRSEKISKLVKFEAELKKVELVYRGTLFQMYNAKVNLNGFEVKLFSQTLLDFEVAFALVKHLLLPVMYLFLALQFTSLAHTMKTGQEFLVLRSWKDASSQLYADRARVDKLRYRLFQANKELSVLEDVTREMASTCKILETEMIEVYDMFSEDYLHTDDDDDLYADA